MPQTSTALKSLTSAVPAFLSGAVTAGVLYAANKLHIPVLDTEVETIVTPFVSAGVAAATHALRKPLAAVEVKVAQVEQKDPLVAILSQTIAQRLAADPQLGERLVQTALDRVSTPVVPAPTFTRTTIPVQAASAPAPVVVDMPAPVGTSMPSTSSTLPPSVAP